MSEQTRIIYPDLCKFIAIFIVTCSHCAQTISGETWTNFLGGTEIDVAFCMPLFMLMSGWFLNFDKLRSTDVPQYVYSKFRRLIIPAISWYLIFCISTTHKAYIYDATTFYWYLTSLFICLLFIFFSAKILRNNILCAILSTLLVLICPYSDFVHINFMFPYIWSGYYLRKVIESNNRLLINTIVLCSLVLGCILSIYWSPDYTVYKCPLKITNINTTTSLIYTYRYLIGLCLSIVIIYIIKKCNDYNTMDLFARYGKISLIIYTFSFVFNGIITKVLNYFNVHFNEYLILDVLSILECIFIVTLSLILHKIAKKNKLTRLIFLGE